MWRPLDISPAKWHEDFQLLTDAWLVRSRSHLVDHRASEWVVPLMALQSLELSIIHLSNMKGLWLWRKRRRYVSVNILLNYFIFAVTQIFRSSLSSQCVLKIWAKSIAKNVSMWAQAQVILRNLPGGHFCRQDTHFEDSMWRKRPYVVLPLQNARKTILRSVHEDTKSAALWWISMLNPKAIFPSIIGGNRRFANVLL